MNEEKFRISDWLKENGFNIPDSTIKLLYFSSRDPEDAGINRKRNLDPRMNMESKSEADSLVLKPEWALFADESPENEIKRDIFRQLGFNLITSIMTREDPSTIFTCKKVSRPENPALFNSRLNDFPSYRFLSPEERWIYLNWLQDLSIQIPAGYVSIYAYGLERQLFGDNKVSAALELLKLSNSPDLGREWVLDSIFYSYIKSNDQDLLDLYLKESSKFPIDNIGILLRYVNKTPLEKFEISDLIERLILRKKNNFHKIQDIYLEELDKYLKEQYEMGTWKFFEDYMIDDLPKKPKDFFLNYSFDDIIRTQYISNLFEYKPFLEELDKIHKIVFENVKSRLKQERAKSIT